ncbi:sensor domain-containing diguanylate cyclase [Pectobacteriaceae bacterium C52]|nr:sensor domain-containing diguanylate cyclase [Pectobacteriaceae bacterium C52]
MRIRKIFQINLLWLILAISIASIVITLFNSYFSIYKVQKKLLSDQIFNFNLNYSSKLSATVESFFSTSREQLTYSAQLIEKNYKDEKNLQSEVERIRQLSHNFNSVVVVNNRNSVIAASPKELNLVGVTLTSNTSQLALKEKKFFISQPYTSTAGNYIIFISVPIKDKEGNQVGYIGGTIYLNNRRILNEFMNTQFSNDMHNIYVVDKNGVIIYNHNKQYIGKTITDEQIRNTIFWHDKGTFLMPSIQGKPPALAGFARVKSSGWTIITLQSSQSVIAPLTDVMFNILKVGSPVVILTLLILTILAFYIVRPLRHLAMSASKMDEPGVIDKIKSVPSWYFEVEQLKRVILLGTVLLHKRIGRLSSEAHTDPLTGLLNRRGLHDSIDMILLENETVSAIVIDIDHFKHVNDTFGHSTGDEVIRLLARLIRSSARKVDLMCRTGGEEFLMLLPGTNIHIAALIAERLRSNVENHQFPGCQHITISVGVTTFNPDKSTFDVAIKTADTALYQAKKDGRNRVVVRYISDDVSPAYS